MNARKKKRFRGQRRRRLRRRHRHLQPLRPPAASASAAPAASTDPDSPTVLPSKKIKGSGQQQKRSYYYAFKVAADGIAVKCFGKSQPAVDNGSEAGRAQPPDGRGHHAQLG